MKHIGFYLIVLVSTACNAQKPIDKAAWIIGTWESKSPQAVFVEQWKKQNDTLYVGAGNMIIGSDTVFNEQLQLQQRGSDLFYIATISGENDGKPTEFKLTSAGKALVFENPTHDYPQKIVYTKQDDNSMLAEVSGNANGKPQKESYPFKKVK